jgi:hypothetical protein
MSSGDVTIPDPDPESAAEEVTGPGDEVMRFERDDLPASLLTPTGNVIGSAPRVLGAGAGRLHAHPVPARQHHQRRGWPGRPDADLVPPGGRHLAAVAATR